jgi:hypothetical protein
MGLLGMGELGRSQGWFAGRVRPPARSFWLGVERLGGGARGRTRMQLIWSHSRPHGFWGSARGRAWKRVSPGNMTPVMTAALLAEIQAYEDRQGLGRDWRVTPPRRRRRSPPRPAPAPKPRPRPRTGPVARTVPSTLVAAARSRRRPVTGQPYARQARSGVPVRRATGAWAPTYASARR